MRTCLALGFSTLIVGLIIAIPFEEIRTAGIVVASVGFAIIIIAIIIHFLNKGKGE